MAQTSINITDEIHREVDKTPEKYRNALLNIVHSFRQSVNPTERDPLWAETQEGLADIKAGRLHSEENIMDWIESWGTDKELQPPNL